MNSGGRFPLRPSAFGLIVVLTHPRHRLQYGVFGRVTGVARLFPDGRPLRKLVLCQPSRWWAPALDPPVNKANLSPGENGEKCPFGRSGTTFSPQPAWHMVSLRESLPGRESAECWGYDRGFEKATRSTNSSQSLNLKVVAPQKSCFPTFSPLFPHPHRTTGARCETLATRRQPSQIAHGKFLLRSSPPL